MARSHRITATIERITVILYALVLFIFTSISAVWIVSSEPVVRAVAQRTHPVLSQGVATVLSVEERMQAATMTTRYVRGSEDRTRMVAFYETDPLAGESSIQHLKDVRDVFDGLRLVGRYYTFAAVTALLWFLFRGRWAVLRRSFQIGASLCLGVPIVLGLIVAVAFDPLFVLFHRVFFPQGNWQFTAYSHLIQVFPESFWIIASVMILALIALVGTILFFLARLLPATSDAC